MAAAFLASLMLLCLHPGNSIVEHFFVRIGDDNQRYDGSVIATMTLSTIIECSTECLRLPSCASFNARKQTTGQYKCTMLKDIPVNPDLTPTGDTQYFEKTCQIPFNPTMAMEYERESENGTNTTGIESYIPLQLYIAGDGGRGVYVVQMTTDYDVSSIEYNGTVHDKTGGSFDRLNAGAMVHFIYPNDFQVFLIDEGIMCTKQTDLGKVPCFPQPIVSKTSLFGTEDVNALLSTPNFDGLYVFGYDEVRVVDVPEFGDWTVNQVVDLSSTTRPPGWTFVPHGVVAAAWLVEYDNENPIFEKALLLTRHYYVVYDFVNDKILKRGHLCV